jgi:hypothetical protein
MVMEPDPQRLRQSSRTSPVNPGEPFTNDEIIDYFGHFYEFVSQDGEYRSPPSTPETVRRFFDQRGRTARS